MFILLIEACIYPPVYAKLLLAFELRIVIAEFYD